MNKYLILLGLVFALFSCSEIIEPEPLELIDSVFVREGTIEDVLILNSLDLGNGTARLSWVVDSSKLSEGDLRIITGIRISYQFPLRPPTDLPFSDGSMTHPIQTTTNEHCFSAFAFSEDFRTPLRIESTICASN